MIVFTIDCLIIDHSPATILFYLIVSLNYCPCFIIIPIFISFNANFIRFITVSTLTTIFTIIYRP